MYKIGEFSTLSKTTIKTLRYYEKESLLIPAFIDPNTGYRYYETNQLIVLSKIISLKETGMSIKDIKKILDGNNMKELLLKRKKEIENDLVLFNIEFSKINYLLEESNMNNEIVFKELPACIVYYEEGVISDFSKIGEFVLKTADDCLKINPNIKCLEPDYCFVSYLDGEYKENNIRVKYSQAVSKKGIESDLIKFEDLKSVEAVCIYHKGAYNTLRNSYNKIMKYIESNEYKIVENPREHYIDGCWNRENVEDYLTEIQVPVCKK